MVDCATYKGNVPLTAQNIKIGGNFTDVGATAIPNWNALSSPAFTKVGDKLFSTTISFDSVGFGDTLKYKFIISTGDWGKCNVLDGNTQECIPVDSACWGLYDDYRILRIQKNAFTVAYFYNTCTKPGAALSATNYSKLDQLTLSPNPITENSSIQFNAATTGKANLQLINSVGQTLNQVEYTVTKTGNQQLDFPFLNLTAGIYYLKINLGNSIGIAKLIVN